MNIQDQVGILTKFGYQLNDELSLQFGADYRTAEINHHRSSGISLVEIIL